MLAGTAAPLVPGVLGAQEIRTFTIATGSIGGTYYPIGGVLADLLTAPPGGVRCRPDEPCGVPGLVVAAQTSDGSVQNVKAVTEGLVDSAFCQADIAHQAWRGLGPFADGSVQDLRYIASLYPEMAQLAVRDAHPGPPWRLGVGAPASGTREPAERLLDAFGIAVDDVNLLDLNPNAALDAKAAGDLDGLLVVAGLPTEAVSEAIEVHGASLMACEPRRALAFLGERPFWRLRAIRAGTYAGQDRPVRTLAVAALWVVRADMDPVLVKGLLEALWSPPAVPILRSRHPVGHAMTLATALEGGSLPLHPAAAAFYRDAGLDVPASLTEDGSRAG
ncbi:MAG: TAXI family TRAP transporter solute-binding subunit [Pseudomonadota bacterium]